MSIRHPKLAPRRSPNTPYRHDLGGRDEPDARFRALRLLVLSHLADGPMTSDQIWLAIGAPDDPGALLPRVLDDLVERDEVEVSRHRVATFGPLREHYSLAASGR